MGGPCTAQMRRTSVTASRRRGVELDHAIFDAVLAELGANGYTGLTFEGVARRAGTSKPVLYRRWSTKVQMVIAAIMSISAQEIVAVDAGSLRDDLIATITAVLQRLQTTGRDVVLGLLSDAVAEPKPGALAILQTKGAQLTGIIVERARDRGEIGVGQVPTLVMALPFDLARYRFLVDGSLDDAAISEVVTQAAVPLLRHYAGSA